MEIVSLPIVFESERLDSRFRLVVVATERARKLINGAKPCVPLKYLKESTVALEEIVSCDVVIVKGKDARKALHDSIAQKEKLAAGPQVEVDEDQVKKEIEKELGNYVDDTEGSAGKSGAED